MKKSKIYTLENGLKIIFYQDKTKHKTAAYLYINYGSNLKEVKKDNSFFKIKNGTAHFLEHLLVEHSIYGNSILEFEKNDIIYNGVTDPKYTHFYIDTVCDFNDNLIKLINIVNNSKFNKEDIEETKPAIIKEIMMNKDNKWDNLLKAEYKCLFKNISIPNTLGEVSDIESMDYEYLKECYEMFYNPSNQILFIWGNFDIKETKKIIEDEYNKINKKNKEYELIEKEEPNKVVKKEDYIKEDINQDYVRLSYKVDISHLTNKERVKLTFYMQYYLSYLFNGSSKLYNDLVKEKICNYNIEHYYYFEDKYIIIQIGLYTDKTNIFIDRVKEIMKEKKYSKKKFETDKKNTILDMILREENINAIMFPFIDNCLTFNYYMLDTIEDIYDQNFNDYKNIINSLDFSNYCVVKMIK